MADLPEPLVWPRRNGKISAMWEKLLTEWLASQDRPEEQRLSLLCHPDDLSMRKAELRLLLLLHPEWQGATITASALVWKGATIAVEQRHVHRYLAGTDG